MLNREISINRIYRFVEMRIKSVFDRTHTILGLIEAVRGRHTDVINACNNSIIVEL